MATWNASWAISARTKRWNGDGKIWRFGRLKKTTWPGIQVVNWVVAWNIFVFSPRSVGKWSNFTSIFRMGWNHLAILRLWPFWDGENVNPSKVFGDLQCLGIKRSLWITWLLLVSINLKPMKPAILLWPKKWYILMFTRQQDIYRTNDFTACRPTTWNVADESN